MWLTRSAVKFLLALWYMLMPHAESSSLFDLGFTSVKYFFNYIFGESSTAHDSCGKMFIAISVATRLLRG